MKSKVVQKLLLTLALTVLTVLGAAAAPDLDTKVTLSFRSAPVETVLASLQKQTGLNFVYSSDLAKTWPKVTIQARKRPAEEVIRDLANLIECQYTVKGNIVSLSAQRLSGRTRTISGYVRDADGEPLIGVPVCIGETRVCTITDDQGFFTFKIPVESAILKFTYLGMEDKYLTVAPGEKDVRANVDMKSNMFLNEVVVTGYQTVAKERATGSFAKVTSEDLRSKRLDNISQLLEGSVTGFNTQSNLIRGTSTMNGVAQPLFVIDGFPVENTRYTSYGALEERIPDVNVHEIESVTVLKDAAAASIYGARAANGVVVITTKKARGNKTSISFNTFLTYNPYRFYEGRLTDAADIVDLEREWASTNPRLAEPSAASYAQSLLNDNVYTSQGIKAIAGFHAGQLTQSQMEQSLNELAQQGYRYYDEMARHAKRAAFSQQYNLSAGKATDGNNFKVSLAYRNDKMNDKYTKDNALSVNVRDILDVTKWLQFEFGSYVSFRKGTEQTFSVLRPGYTFQPYDRLKNDDGSNYTFSASEQLTASQRGMIETYGLYSMDITPLDETGRNLMNRNEILSRTYGKLNFALPFGMRYNVMFQYEYGSDHARQLKDKQSYDVRNFVNQYATAAENGSVRFNVPYGNVYFREHQTSKAWTFRQQLNFDRTFGGKHNVIALAGLEVRRNVNDYENSTLFNYDPDMLSFSLVDQATLNNTYGLLGGYGLMASDFAYLRFLDNRYVSLYANAAYAYDDRYLLSASIRWDRSNLWGTSSEYQKKPIWSIGAGWNIERESWFDLHWIDRLKLRASYGIGGNVAKDAAPYMTATYSPNYNVGGIYGSVSTRPNPMLRWEKTTTTDIAVDFAFLGNRLAGTVEFYNKKGTDLLANTMGVPTEGFGYTTYRINNGQMRNRGVEISLNGQVVRTENFSFNVNANYSHNRNEVLYVNVTAPVYFLQLDYPESYPIIGNPYNSIYAYRWAGLSENGLPRVYNAAGDAVTTNPSDLAAIVYAGTTEPADMASLNLSLRYKQWDFSCLWVYQGGHRLRNTDLPMLGNSYNAVLRSYVTNLAPVNKDIVNRWRKPGDEATTDVPAAIFAENPLFSSAGSTIYGYADINVINAVNLRLANISLSYTLPSMWVQKAGLSSARVQMNVENAFTFARSDAAKYLLGGYNAPNYVLGFYLDF